jgi:hypothetical protein
MNYVNYLKEPLDLEGVKLGFYIKNVRFETMEESIAILKSNTTITKNDYLEYFSLFLKTSHYEMDKTAKLKIPYFTESELFEIIDETPTMTTEEAMKRYSGSKVATVISYLETEFSYDEWLD